MPALPKIPLTQLPRPERRDMANIIQALEIRASNVLLATIP
jgi:hypothetical protein